MKKIMFNDKFGLTEAVLSGCKTQTRRIVSEKLWDEWTDYDNLCCAVGVGGLVELGVDVTRQYSKCEKFFLDNSPFKVGEVVAIAQSYKNAGVHSIPCEDEEFGCYDFPAEQTNGWNNKMYVRADLMPNRIRITNVRVERLHDISDEDCIMEGVVKREHIIPTPAQQIIPQYFPCQHLIDCATKVGWGRVYDTPREAYADLIDKVSGKGTWHSNPYVFIYEFELINDNEN